MKRKRRRRPRVELNSRCDEMRRGVARRDNDKSAQDVRPRVHKI